MPGGHHIGRVQAHVQRDVVGVANYDDVDDQVPSTHTPGQAEHLII
jgi:hypothetical protein